MKPEERIIIALDGFKDLDEAKVAIKGIGVPGITVKMNDLLDKHGEEAVKVFKDLGYKVFADRKVLDITDTARRITGRYRDARADFLTVHASGYDEMMKECVESAGEDMKILAVTVLTSLDHTASMHVFGKTSENAVLNFAFSAYMSGAHGVITSPQELEALRGYRKESNGCVPELLVVPGVRPKWAEKNDQKRVATPAEAIRDGADYLVIGRPILKPPPEIGSPRKAFWRIVEEIANVTHVEKHP